VSGLHQATSQTLWNPSGYDPKLSLRQEARAAGCVTVSGLEMFVGQAAEQFQLFTGMQPPVDLMRQVVLDSLS